MKMKWIRKFHQDDSGASTLEYAILMGLIVLVIIGAVAIFGSSVKGLFSNANEVFPK
jgi:Flp pilus assembly pilin Flp